MPLLQLFLQLVTVAFAVDQNTLVHSFISLAIYECVRVSLSLSLSHPLIIISYCFSRACVCVCNFAQMKSVRIRRIVPGVYWQFAFSTASAIGNSNRSSLLLPQSDECYMAMAGWLVRIHSLYLITTFEFN